MSHIQLTTATPTESSVSAIRAPYELRHLLRSPNLLSASFVNTIPFAGVMHPITTLSIRLGSEDEARRPRDSGWWYAQDLVNLLRSQTSLEVFKLEFYEKWSFTFRNTTTKTVELPSIESVDLHWHASPEVSSPSRDSDILRLFRLISMENVKTFRFKLTPVYTEPNGFDNFEEPSEVALDLKTYLSFFLSQEQRRFPLLEFLHLELRSDNTTANTIHLPTSYIKNIKHLSLRVNVDLAFCKPGDEPDGVVSRLSQLKTVMLRNCDALTPETVRKIVEAIKELGNWETFQLLVVDRCKHISRSSLEDIISPEKLETYSDTARTTQSQALSRSITE